MYASTCPVDVWFNYFPEIFWSHSREDSHDQRVEMAKVLRKSHPATRHILLAEGVVSFIFWGEDFLPNLPTKDLGKWMDHDPNWFTCFFFNWVCAITSKTEKPCYISRWWFQRSLIFIPIRGKMNPCWPYFSNGLVQPPTRYCFSWWYENDYTCMDI